MATMKMKACLILVWWVFINNGAIGLSIIAKNSRETFPTDVYFRLYMIVENWYHIIPFYKNKNMITPEFFVTCLNNRRIYIEAVLQQFYWKLL